MGDVFGKTRGAAFIERKNHIFMAAISILPYGILCLIAIYFRTLWWGKGLLLLSAFMSGIHMLLLIKGIKGNTEAQLRQQLTEQNQRMQEMLLQNKQEQLNALQSQINPHFLYNTLDTIRGMALEQECYSVADCVSDLSSMFKYTMDYSVPTVNLQAEIRHVQRYMKILELRSQGRYQFEQIFQCEKEDLTRITLPKFVLQPLVENAVNHGLKARADGGKVTLRYLHTDQNFIVVVSDNGCGMTDDMVMRLNRNMSLTEERIVSEDRYGIALENVNTRLKMNCGEEYGLHFASTLGLGTEVTMTLPMWKKEEA